MFLGQHVLLNKHLPNEFQLNTIVNTVPCFSSQVRKLGALHKPGQSEWVKLNKRGLKTKVKSHPLFNFFFKSSETEKFEYKCKRLWIYSWIVLDGQPKLFTLDVLIRLCEKHRKRARETSGVRIFKTKWQHSKTGWKASTMSRTIFPQRHS